MIVIFRKKLRIIMLLSSITLITANKPHPPKPRSVNVALETSVLFDPKDMQQNRYYVSNIRQFMDKVLRVLEPQKLSKDLRTHSKRRDSDQQLDEGTDSVKKIETKAEAGTSLRTLLDFVRTVGQTFVNLSGNKIAEAVSNMHVEVVPETTKSKHKGHVTAMPDTFQSLRQGKHVKRHIKEVISDSINDWMKRYPKEVRTMMNNTVDTTNPLLKSFARRMNNYYNENDIKKLKKLLKKFKRHIENDQDTSDIVNDLLNNAVFKKYGSLNETTKLALMEDLKLCSEILLSKDVFKEVNENLAVLTRRSLPNKETGEIRDIDDMTYTNLRRSIDNKLRDTKGEKKDDKKKKRPNTNETIVDVEKFLASVARDL